jgi:hypothetical protein
MVVGAEEDLDSAAQRFITATGFLEIRCAVLGSLQS